MNAVDVMSNAINPASSPNAMRTTPKRISPVWRFLKGGAGATAASVTWASYNRLAPMSE